jgi:hypothetical protein
VNETTSPEMPVDPFIELCGDHAMRPTSATRSSARRSRIAPAERNLNCPYPFFEPTLAPARTGSIISHFGVYRHREKFDAQA